MNYTFAVGSAHPSRIVCLSAEAVDVLHRLGAGDCIVGVTGFAREPLDAAPKPRVSGFSTVNYDKIDALEPDLIITFSDVQADATRELIRRGHTVLATNQRSINDIFDTIFLIGRLIDKTGQARSLVDEMRREIFERKQSSTSRERPRVYFEEWHEPLISGIQWVSELIEAAGGADIFPELRNAARAVDRVVTSEEIIRRRPEIIVASWCGKKVDLKAIVNRAGWDALPAVRNGCIHEIDSDNILQPGPGILKGFRQLCALIEKAI